MNKKLQKIIEGFIPFVVLGIAIALFMGLLFMFFYIAVWGLIIGLVLWIAMLVKQYLFARPLARKEKGRIIEHVDKK